MKEKIESLLQDKDVVAEINFIKGNNSTFMPGKLIGEVFRYCVIHQSDSNIEKADVVQYLKDIKGLMIESANKEEKERDAFFSTEKSKIILKTIARSLNIDISTGTISKQDENRIKDYFLTNYVKNGYVFHSFPTARKNSVAEKGFTEIEQIWNDAQVKEVVNIFNEHGVLKALGGYGFYKPGGMYVEHDPEKIFFHSLSSPEWFKFFTSSSHVESTQDLTKSPFFLKDYDACKQNVVDLCRNTKLTKQEANKVISLFEDCWSKLGARELTTAIIPKDKVKKNEIPKDITENMSLIDTVSYVLEDKAEQFAEHTGNVIDSSVVNKISGQDLEIVQIPPADTFITAPTYKRETREDLFDPAKNIGAICLGIASGAFELSYKQYSTVMNNIESTFENDLGKLEEIDKNLNKFDRTIKHSNLSTQQQNHIISTFQGYEKQRQEYNYQNQSPLSSTDR